jgi:hypothetical protein
MDRLSGLSLEFQHFPAVPMTDPTLLRENTKKDKNPLLVWFVETRITGWKACATQPIPSSQGYVCGRCGES